MFHQTPEPQSCLMDKYAPELLSFHFLGFPCLKYVLHKPHFEEHKQLNSVTTHTMHTQCSHLSVITADL